MPHLFGNTRRLRATSLSAVAGFLACLGPSPLVGQRPAIPRASLTLFAYDHRAPLAYEEMPAESLHADVTHLKVSFARPRGGRVTGFMAVPRRAGPHAGVVVLHGLPGTAAAAIRNGLEMAVRGAVVLAIDAPWTQRNSLPDFTPNDSVDQVQLMVDLQRAVDVLVARPDVDASRLAYVGGSYGGAMGGLFVSIERRLAAAALFVPDGGLVSHLTDSNGKAIGPLATKPVEVQKRWLAAMWPIEPIRFVNEASATPLLLQNGRRDQLVTNEDAEELHRTVREPKTVLWYDADHNLGASAVSDRLAWLSKQIGIRR